MRTGGSPAEWKVVPLAQGGVDVFKSPAPDDVFLGNPSIVTLPGGRIVVSLDLGGPGVKHLQGTKGRAPNSGHWLQGKLFVSADKGKTWTFKTDYPFQQAQLFRVGGNVYLVGLAGDFKIIKSMDGGDTWSKPADLMPADGEYSLTPVNVLSSKGHIYLTVQKRVVPVDGRGKEPPAWVPVVMRAREGTDLTNRKVWTTSEPGKPLMEFLPDEYVQRIKASAAVAQSSDKGRRNSPGPRHTISFPNWFAPHLLEIRDPSHVWHDPRGGTMQLLATLRHHKGNTAVAARLVESESGQMTIEPRLSRDGAKATLTPIPGGSLKFDIVYDEESKLFWLASNPVSDSMTVSELGTRADRQRLMLYFSRNLVDWNLAGQIDTGAATRELRHFSSLAIGGTDLHVVCCSGQSRPAARGYSDRITFHAIPTFRELAW